MPNLKGLDSKYTIRAIVDIKGVNAKNTAIAFGARYSTTDVDEVLNDNQVDLVIITTSHKSHGELVLKALSAEKHVFVEKPLAISQKDIDKIKFYYRNGFENKPILFVGYNRRFSKPVIEIKGKIKLRKGPLFVQYRMNAGYVPLDHWIYFEGGRIVGEACHIIDLMTCLTESTIDSVSYESLNPKSDKFRGNDNKSIILKYSDGSVCNIQYFSVGNDGISKEYMEIHYDNNSIIMDDYKSLKSYGVKVKSFNNKKGMKGHKDELICLFNSIVDRNRPWPIALWDLLQTSEVSFMIK